MFMSLISGELFICLSPFRHCLLVSLCTPGEGDVLFLSCIYTSTLGIRRGSWKKGWPVIAPPPRPGSSRCPVSRSAFGQGFERAQLSDRSRDTPSFLLNSGEDECDSCWVWHFLWDLTLCQAGLCFREATCWVSAAPKVATDQWFLATKAGLCPGRRDCAQWKAPQGVPQGCTWASTGLHLPKMDKRLTHLSPFIFQEDGKCQGSQALRHQPGYNCQCRHHSKLSYHLSVILYIDFIKSVVTLFVQS